MTTLTELDKHLNHWLRWFRYRRAVTWAVRGLAAGLAISFALSWVTVFKGALLREEFVLLVAAIAASSITLMSVAAYLWPVSRLRAAQLFDRRFALRERVSTALELAAADRSAYPPDLIRRQLEDAVAASRGVRPQTHLPLRVGRTEIIAAVLLIAGILFIRVAGESFFQAALQTKAVQQAIAQEVVQLEAIRNQIEADDALTPEQRRALTAPLDEAARRLRDSQTLEQATSVFVSTEQQLEALADPQAQPQVQALRETGDSLRQDEGGPLQSFGQNLAEGDTLAAAQALHALRVDVNDLTQEETEALAQQLEHAADALEATQPELARQLRDAAQAARNGDRQAAQRALEQAAQTLTRAGQQIIASQQAGQIAAQVGQGRQRVIQAGRSAQASQGQSAQGGQLSQGDQASPAQAQGQSGPDTQGDGSDGGAGRGERSGDGSLGGEAGADPIGQDNAPGDAGERVYEQIYAPQRLGGSGGEDVALPGSGEPGERIGQGNTTPGEEGRSLVPYVEVFAAYARVYRQAIESGRVPIHLRTVIREYFSSLEP